MLQRAKAPNNGVSSIGSSGLLVGTACDCSGEETSLWEGDRGRAGAQATKSPGRGIERSLPKISLLPVLYCLCMGWPKPHRMAMASYFGGHSDYSDKETIRKL